MLPAQAEVARASGDAETARSARDELAEIADQIASPAITAAREWTAGITALLEEDHDRAIGHLAEARKRWNEAGAPYESATVALALAEAQLAGGNDAAAAAELDAARDAVRTAGSASRRATDGGAPSADLGRRRAPARAARTFLFTDIVGSTALIEVIGDEAWNDLRRWHNEVLRSSFDDHDGEEIDHAGDGFFVAFPDAERGVRCAVQIQRRLAEHRRTHGFAPQVRMGLHATTATRDESGYTGLGVHTASRIGSLAGAGEILASAETLGGRPRRVGPRSGGASRSRGSPSPSTWSRSSGGPRRSIDLGVARPDASIDLAHPRAPESTFPLVTDSDDEEPGSGQSEQPALRDDPTDARGGVDPSHERRPARPGAAPAASSVPRSTSSPGSGPPSTPSSWRASS